MSKEARDAVRYHFHGLEREHRTRDGRLAVSKDLSLLVMRECGEHAGPDGRGMRAGVPRLARLVRHGERQVRRCVQALVEEEWLLVDQELHGKSTSYWLNLSKLAATPCTSVRGADRCKLCEAAAAGTLRTPGTTPDRSDRVTSVTPDSARQRPLPLVSEDADTSGREPLPLVSPKPVVNHQEPVIAREAEPGSEPDLPLRREATAPANSQLQTADSRAVPAPGESTGQPPGRNRLRDVLRRAVGGGRP